MSESLQGARVALLEARRENELAQLVVRHGGVPICVPALREVDLECTAEAARAIDAAGRPGAVVVLATGVGLDRWLSIAAVLGRGREIHDALARATVVCRGPKPVMVLKREKLAAHFRAPPPHTTSELLACLEAVVVEYQDVVFIHDGSGSRAVCDALERRGARVFDVQPYGWALPEDTEPLRALVRSIVSGDVDAIAVTTQVQAKHLFDVADSMGARAALAEALRTHVVVAAVGPTSARALEQLGTPAHVIPEHSKMGPLVLALARAMQDRSVRAPASAVTVGRSTS